MFKDIVLEAKGIWKGYREEGAFKWVLRNVNLQVLRGDFLAFLGNPGTGKSVLLKLLGFREIPDRGKVYFEGRLVGRFGEQELKDVYDERVLLI